MNVDCVVCVYFARFVSFGASFKLAQPSVANVHGHESDAGEGEKQQLSWA